MVERALQAGGETQPQVFVSYARHDAKQVLTITRLLEQEGVSVWRDEERILGGQYYGEQIVHAIAHSRVVVLMCSPQAFQSDNVHTEVLLTWDHYHRRYIPVWLAPPSDIPERFRYCLARCQWIDAHSQPPERWLPQLLKAFESLGVDSRGSKVQADGSAPRTPGAAGEGGRPPGLRFRPGDKPIRGADWELERLLGNGGFGEVWKARNPHLSSVPPVALKFCLELDERGKDLLRHEADMVLRAQQQVRSTGIVPLMHAYLSNDPPCLEYPYIEGGTLVRLLDESRESASPLTPVHVQRIIEQIAKIVSPGHRATPKLVHRDLKPSNILVERRGDRKVVLKVTDFGIGGLASQPVLERSRSSSSLVGNMASVLMGSYSPLYASPQQVRGDKPDPRDDVYALGVIWYQLLAGDLTAPAPTGRRWIDDLRRRGMSDAAVDLLSSCFESVPAHRPDDGAVLFERLQAIAASTPTKSAGSVPGYSLVEPEAPQALKSPNAPTPQTARALTRPPVSTTSPSVSPAPEVEREAAPEPSEQLEPTGHFRRWVAAGALGLAGVLGAILYVTTRADRPPMPNGRSGSAPAAPGAASPGPSPSLDTESITTRTAQIRLKLIPAGSFPMGSLDDDRMARGSEKPRHPVRITRPFYLGIYEVTRGQFRQFVDDSRFETEAEKDGIHYWVPDENEKTFGPNARLSWKSPGFEQTDAHPVVNVSWNDAQAFLAWLSLKEGQTYRLPTEAEWEYACRAGSTATYAFGEGAFRLASVGNIADATAKQKYPTWPCLTSDDRFVYTAPVGRYQVNAWGLYDMYGNVWEWCSDGFAADYYAQSPRDDPRGVKGSADRVYRGGGFGSDASNSRSACRITQPPGYRDCNLGFRVARTQSAR